MDDDLADLEGLLEAHVLPSLAAVGRFVDAVAVGDRVARVRLSGADPDDVLVRRGDADIADGDGALLVELMIERDTVVDRLEQSAGRRGNPVGAQIALTHGDGRDAAAHPSRADGPPAERLDPVLGERSLGLLAGRGND